MMSRRVARLALVISVAGGAVPLWLPRIADAATITTDTFDEVAAPDCAVAGHCSLRAAVLQANGMTGATIQLRAGTYQLTFAALGNTDDGLNGDLEILASMTIAGAGAQQTKIVADGNLADRVFEVDGNADPTRSLTMTDLTITKGSDETAFTEGNGGGGLNDGGNLTLKNVVIDQNTTLNSGGGIASVNAATNTYMNSTFSTNTAAGVGGGLFLNGTTTGANTFSNLYFTGNSANSGAILDAGGGAIYNGLGGTGTVNFADLMTVANHAPGMRGGAVYEDSFTNTNPNYTNVTLGNNDAFNSGGGLYAASGRVNMTNATITGNKVTTVATTDSSFGRGGGIALGRNGSITLNNATVNGNQSTRSGAGIAAALSADQATMHNTIVVQNISAGTTNNCFAGATATVSSTGYNLADDTTCNLTGAGDRQGSALNPNLGALQDNTGPPDGAPGATSPCLTEALPAGSIAIDTADPSSANNPATDERHVTRPFGPQTDVGAVEFSPAAAVQPILPRAGRSPLPPQPPAPLAVLMMAMAAVAAARIGLARQKLI